MRVSAPAERGRANEAALDVLAAALGVARDRVTLVAGASARDKVVAVSGIDAVEAERRLGGRLGRESE